MTNWIYEEQACWSFAKASDVVAYEEQFKVSYTGNGSTTGAMFYAPYVPITIIKANKHWVFEKASDVASESRISDTPVGALRSNGNVIEFYEKTV